MKESMVSLGLPLHWLQCNYALKLLFYSQDWALPTIERPTLDTTSCQPHAVITVNVQFKSTL